MISATSAVFDALHARSLSDPEGFWGEAAEEIDWFQRWDRVLDDSRPPFARGDKRRDAADFSPPLRRGGKGGESRGVCNASEDRSGDRSLN